MTGEMLQELQSGIVGFAIISFSPNSQLLILASDSITGLTVLPPWNLHTGGILGQRECCGKGGDGLAGVTFSPDGQHLAVASDSQTIITLWSLNKEPSELNDHSYEISAISFSPDSQLLASASWDETVVLWNPTTGKLSGNLEATMQQLVLSHSRPMAKGWLQRQLTEW